MRSSLILIMAIACGVTVANLYYNQPLLALLARVPMGDLLERRRLIVSMMGLTAIALAFAAVSPTVTWLLVASFMKRGLYHVLLYWRSIGLVLRRSQFD